ncbi:hypothetical protein RB195_016765 [Necator americanus]|uniref:Ig-like domain-containing protein n=1 Tax=Necator americanus TaxID=51031 RepID=A0ABR1C222_NECAM
MNDEVRTTLEQKSLNFTYNSSETPIEVDCAEGSEIGAVEIQAMGKKWQKDGQDSFRTSNMIFVENNRSLRFTTLAMEDSGVYTCCAKRSENNYKCFDHSLNVIPAIDDATDLLLHNDNSTGSENRTETIWSVTLADDHLLNAQEGDTYFVKLVDGNTSDVRCLSDTHVNSILTTVNNPHEYGHVLIRNFNCSIHCGGYACNISYTHDDNVSEETEILFTVVTSSRPNIYQNVLDYNAVAELLTRTTSSKFLVDVIFIIFLCFMS